MIDNMMCNLNFKGEATYVVHLKLEGQKDAQV
jgi:hypothetical protein